MRSITSYAYSSGAQTLAFPVLQEPSEKGFWLSFRPDAVKLDFNGAVRDTALVQLDDDGHSRAAYRGGEVGRLSVEVEVSVQGLPPVWYEVSNVFPWDISRGGRISLKTKARTDWEHTGNVRLTGVPETEGVQSSSWDDVLERNGWTAQLPSGPLQGTLVVSSDPFDFPSYDETLTTLVRVDEFFEDGVNKRFTPDDASVVSDPTGLAVALSPESLRLHEDANGERSVTSGPDTVQMAGALALDAAEAVADAVYDVVGAWADALVDRAEKQIDLATFIPRKINQTVLDRTGTDLATEAKDIATLMALGAKGKIKEAIDKDLNDPESALRKTVDTINGPVERRLKAIWDTLFDSDVPLDWMFEEDEVLKKRAEDMAKTWAERMGDRQSPTSFRNALPAKYQDGIPAGALEAAEFLMTEIVLSGITVAELAPDGAVLAGQRYAKQIGGPVVLSGKEAYAIGSYLDERVHVSAGTRAEVSLGQGDDAFRGANRVDEAFGHDGADALIGRSGADKLWGGAQDDFIRGDKGKDQLRGDDGDDEIRGGGSADVIEGGAGNDSLSGDAGKDSLDGGAGNDSLSGAAGKDSIEGGEGNDRIFGGAAADSLNGGAGNDRVFGDDGDDLIEGEQGRDRLSGGEGDDELFGGNDNDRLRGDADDDLLDGGWQNDRLFGGAGNDTLRGGFHDDRLFGGAGDDVLFGGGAFNTLKGGAGADVFAFEDGFFRDRILDFDLDKDALDFSDRTLFFGRASIVFGEDEDGHLTVGDFNDRAVLVGLDLDDAEAVEIRVFSFDGLL